MIEILAGDLDKAIVDLKINAIKTYQCNYKWWEYQENYQIWEMSEEEFKRFENIIDDLEFYSEANYWRDDWGWWRYAIGSVMSGDLHRYNIKNHYLIAWDGLNREIHDWAGRTYDCLLQYFSEELSLSSEKNINALSVDLAKMNNIKMSELWQKYMG